jgi:hypothetical protein
MSQETKSSSAPSGAPSNERYEFIRDDLDFKLERMQ